MSGAQIASFTVSYLPNQTMHLSAGTKLGPCEIAALLGARLDNVILKALEKDREVRCQTASELRADLKRLKREMDLEKVRGVRLQPDPARDVAQEQPVSPADRRTVGRGGQADQAFTVAVGANFSSHEVRLEPNITNDRSSDAQVVADVLKRHRGGLTVAASFLVMALLGALYLVSTRRAQAPPSVPVASLDSLQVVQLTTSGNAERPAISPDSKYVAYIQREGNEYSVWIRQVATPSNVQIVRPETGVRILAATVTPDGTFADFVRRRELWRVPFLGGTAKLLINDVWSPVGWSPDGGHVAFVRRDSTRSPTTDALIMADPDGSHERVLIERRGRRDSSHTASLVNRTIDPRGPANGRMIALAAVDGTFGQVVIVDVATGSDRVVPLPQGQGIYNHSVAWLDGTSLALNRETELGAARQLWRFSFPEGQQFRLTNDLTSYEGISLTAAGDGLVTARAETRISIWAGDSAAKNLISGCKRSTANRRVSSRTSPMPTRSPTSPGRATASASPSRALPSRTTSSCSRA